MRDAPRVPCDTSSSDFVGSTRPRRFTDKLLGSHRRARRCSASIKENSVLPDLEPTKIVETEECGSRAEFWRTGRRPDNTRKNA